MPVPPRADRAEIARALALLYEPGDVVELRAPVRRGQTTAGYFDDFEKLASAAMGLSGRVQGVYPTINPVTPALLARACNRLEPYAKTLTTDGDIRRRHWIPFDFDANRPAGISATDEEHALALATADRGSDFLLAHGVRPENFLSVDSGNGGHVHLRVDLPNDAASTELVRHVLEVVARHVDTERVHLDQTMFNASRIVKLPGTIAAKGDALPDRPHRRAILRAVPALLLPTDLDVLRGLAALRPAPPPRPARPGGMQAPFDVRDFLAAHDVSITREKPWTGTQGNGSFLEFAACVFNASHDHGEAGVIALDSGMLLYRCHHNSCRTKVWADVRAQLEPPRAHARRVGAPNGPWPSDDEAPRHADAREPARPVDPLGLLVSEIAREPVHWLWPGYLPRGKLVIVEGPPDVGKTTLTLDLAARVSRGAAMPNSLTTRPPAGVVVLSAEDGLGDTIRPRLEEAGADLARIVTARPEELPSLDRAGLAYIRRLIERVAGHLAILDPLMAFIPDAVDTYKDHASRRLLRTLAGFAAELDVTLLVVRHLRKGAIGLPSDAGGGSIAYSAAARVVLLTGRDPTLSDRYVLATAKNNLSARAPALSYALVPAGGVVAVAWHGESPQDAAALLTVPLDTDERRGVEEAVAFLETMLGAGEQPAADVRREARKVGLADRTLDRAKQRLRVRSRRENTGGPAGAGRWMWGWPGAPAEAASSPPPSATIPPAEPKDANQVALPGLEVGVLGVLEATTGVFRPSEGQGRHEKEVAWLGRCPRCGADGGHAGDGVWHCLYCGSVTTLMAAPDADAPAPEREPGEDDDLP